MSVDQKRTEKRLCRMGRVSIASGAALSIAGLVCALNSGASIEGFFDVIFISLLPPAAESASFVWTEAESDSPALTIAVSNLA